MHLTKEINQEINLINTDYFTKGEYIYMAMGLVGNHRVCIAVAYKIDYCIKKALQFTEVDPNVKFTHINKVKVGEKEAEKRFEWES
ncbi:hypothetical protein [Capnocytophaga sp. G2]|jgi:hypothetical protein|uniref:hypothetical protein n=1 Tax=Capnocytophaga sp. G2 TaxID=3110695 RepID=UPI002B46AEA0|nr:hypothetical protein [Capnocytophaga sp. G2]MEB3005531.1 hypothetical protein [Capnocytophaga sp. G2]